MGKIILFILERLPYLEIAIRCFLWKFPKIKDIIKNRKAHDYSSRKNINNKESWNKVKKQIEDYGIKKGDILLVHSSMGGLAQTGVTAKEVIDFLLQLVGAEGTLVFAAYPQCKQYQGNENILYYDPKRTISWTGLLPNIFCKYDGVIRSEFPYNSLAAKGYYAEKMMNNNLVDDISQGPNSSWQFCVEHHAKILYLGVSAALSCTMMNYPEDALGDAWPIKDWYYMQQYAIKSGDQIIYKTIRQRYPDWYRFYAMFHSELWLRKKMFLTRNIIDGIYVGYTPDMSALAEELLAQGRKGKSVYRIPKKYWK